MSGLNWEKAAKNAKADKRATGLDLLRNPADEMSEITRLQQARQKKNRPTPRAKLDVVDVAPELAGQAVGEAIQRGRLIDKALTFEEQQGCGIKASRRENREALARDQEATEQEGDAQGRSGREKTAKSSQGRTKQAAG